MRKGQPWRVEHDSVDVDYVDVNGAVAVRTVGIAVRSVVTDYFLDTLGDVENLKGSDCSIGDIQQTPIKEWVGRLIAPGRGFDIIAQENSARRKITSQQGDRTPDQG